MEKTKGFFTEFKAFIARGNVMDMAVGVVIGGAFTAIVNALIEAVINPIITLIAGQTDFSDISIGMFPIGLLISAVINFLLIAFVVFLLVRSVNRVKERAEKLAAEKLLKKAEEEEKVAEEEKKTPTQEELLQQIVDLLKAQNGTKAE